MAFMTSIGMLLVIVGFKFRVAGERPLVACGEEVTVDDGRGIDLGAGEEVRIDAVVFFAGGRAGEREVGVGVRGRVRGEDRVFGDWGGEGRGVTVSLCHVG